jgi:hypothetical protein
MIGDVSPYIDIANIHNYYSGFPPETDGYGGAKYACGVTHKDPCGRYGSLQYAIALAKISAPSLPVYSTESGYGTDGAHSNVDELTQGKYIPRLLLHQFSHGIARSYIYQLADSHRSGFKSFGLLETSEDNKTHAEKPAFRVVASINGLLSDPGPPFAPVAPGYRIVGASPTVETVWLEKRDKTYWLAIWSNAASYDVNGTPPGELPAAADHAELQTDSNVAVTGFSFDDAGNMHRVPYRTGNSFTLQVADRVTLFEIATPAP